VPLSASRRKPGPIEWEQSSNTFPFDEAALVLVREPARDVGCEPVAGGGGGLERAGLLEATATLFIGLWVGEGADAQAIAPPLAYATGPER